MATTTTGDIPQAIRDVYSQEIIYQAQPKLRFAQFAKRKDDLTVTAGGTIRFTKFNNIAKGGKLAESTAIQAKKMDTSEVAISVEEYGNAIEVSEIALRKSMFNILQEGAQNLAHDAAKVLDEEIRDTALSSSNFIYGGDKASAATMDANSVFNPAAIRSAVEALETNNAPKFDNQYYICIAHPHQLKQLRSDSEWIATHQYAGVDMIYKGEVGMYEGVRFISSTQMPAYSASESNTLFSLNMKTWRAVIFGENSFGWAVALDIELRDSGVLDYGRVHGLAWYAIWGFGLVEEANIMNILTT